MHGIDYKWLTSYLKTRKHYAEINGKRSNILGTNKGIPQGSVLGSILYIIYVNDFPLERSDIYADYTWLILIDIKNEKMCNVASQKITLVQN